MGAGKTTVGRQLARRLGRAFLDSDHEIVERTGVPVSTIFEIEGEEGFRRREAQTIAELTAMPGIVLATGGGAVLDPDNRRHLRDSGWVAYLNVPPALLYERTRHDRNRPLLQTADPHAKLTELFQQRDLLYRQVADIVIQSGKQSAHALMLHLADEIEAFRKTRQ